jgi:uncharacterized protein
MELTQLRKESIAQGGFYVPMFEILVEGVGLPREVLRDVTQITYKDNVKELDSFELTVNNWDAVNREFKYVGSETPESLKKNPLHSLFDPCAKAVEVKMGYLQDHLRVMLQGNFTTVEPNFPSAGGPILTVRGLNVLHKLRRKQYTYAWPKKRDSDIAESIQYLTDPETKKKRFPLPIVSDPTAKGLEKPIEYVAQQNQYDIDFLLTRARKRGYVVFVEEKDPKRKGGPKEQQLYFGPPKEKSPPALRAVRFELELGKSIMDFKPTLTTANQVRSVTVNGWDKRAGKPIKVSVTLDDKKFSKDKDLYEVLEKCDPREEVVVEEPVFTAPQARERALAILSERLRDRIKASVTCVGLPDLRAGQFVNITGFGSRLSRLYFITDTTHTINDQGYSTKFNVRLPEPGEST